MVDCTGADSARCSPKSRDTAGMHENPEPRIEWRKSVPFCRCILVIEEPVRSGTFDELIGEDVCQDAGANTTG